MLNPPTERRLARAHVGGFFLVGLPAVLGVLAVCAGLLGAGEAVAQSVLPEVVLVLDTSQSMQFKVGADKEPVCTGPKPERSRWIAVREMLGGTFANYACSKEALPAHPDQVNVPQQKFGSPICVPGIAHSLFEPYLGVPSSTISQPVGDLSWAKNGPYSNLAELRLQGDANDTVLPYFSYDLSGVPVAQTWVAGVLTVRTHLPSATGIPEAYLVRFAYPPTAKTARELICDIDGGGLNPVSPPTKIAPGPGMPTSFALTKAELAKINAERKAGAKEFYFALVPVDGTMAADCSGRTGTTNPFSVTFEGPATSARPKLSIAVGKTCPPEGPVAHFQPQGTQLKDGILDVFGPSIKFALLTMDNVLDPSPAVDGWYSYGATMGSLWGQIGIGIQNPFHKDSESRAIPRGDDLASRAAAYKEITTTLATIRPRAGTPLGQVIADVDGYFGPGPYADPHFQSIAQDPVNGDPYYDCRSRLVVLITDGGANLAGGTSDGRSAALQAATSLRSKGVYLHVVAVGHPEAKAGEGPPAADLDFLSDLAAAAGTGKAVVANTPKELVDYLRPVLNATAAVGEVLTRAHYTLATGKSDENLHSFHAKSIFQKADPLLTEGVIEERIFKCGAGCVDPTEPGRSSVCKVIDFADRLKARSVPRRLYTMVDGKRVDLKATEITADEMAITRIGLAPKLVPDPITSSCSTLSGTFNLSNPAERDQYRDHLIALLRGDAGSCREKTPLGAPARAQPVVLEPASTMGLRDPAFVAYRDHTVTNTRPFSLANPPGSHKRPTMLFAATHDGMLHAFRTDNDPNIDVRDQLAAGDEMWSWLPGFNLRRAKQLRMVSEADASYLGAAVVSGHFMLDRPRGDVAQQSLRWRAVVIGGAGEAGAGYTAIDVTAPDNPRILWEITPDHHCWGDSKVGAARGPACAFVPTFEEMGRSTALPVVVNLFFGSGQGDTRQQAVAIIAGGKPPNDSELQNFGVDGMGKRVIYVVRLENGEVVRKFTIADMDMTGMTASVPDKAKQLGYFYTEPACYNSAPGQLATRCFIGDSKGMLWRMDLSDVDPSRWKLHFFHDAYSGSDTRPAYTRPITSADRVPVLSPPSLAMSRSAELVVVYGTGRLDDRTSTTRRHLVYSLSELFALDSTGSAARAVYRHNWGVALGASTSFVGPPLIFSGTAYWASYTIAASGACTSGTGAIWGVDFRNRGQPLNSGNAPRVPDPGFASGDKLVRSQVLGQYKPSPVDIAPVPACVGGCNPGDANCFIGKASALSNNKPRYEVQVGVAGTARAKNQTPPSGKAPKVGTVSRQIAAPRSTSVVTGWDLLLD